MIAANFRSFKNRNHHLIILTVVLLLFAAMIAGSQESGTGFSSFLIRSMGMPPVWKPYCGLSVFLDRRVLNDHGAAGMHAGLYKDITNPMTGLLGIGGEVYYRNGGRMSDGGLRLLLSSRLLFLQAGADYSIRDDKIRALLCLEIPLRRGGPLGRGGNLRYDWMPGSHNTFGIGLSLPLGQPFMGKTRPVKNFVRLPKAGPVHPVLFETDPKLREILDGIRIGAVWIDRFTMPFLDENMKADHSSLRSFRKKMDDMKAHIRSTDVLFPNGHSFEEEVHIYHRLLEEAFAVTIFRNHAVVDSSLLMSVTDRARCIMFDEIILPYNGLLGQHKKRDNTKGYGAQAAGHFDNWLRVSSGVPAENREGVSYVFRQMVRIIENIRKESRKRWGDSRFVWIPCHLALRFGDHDTQSELDAILEKALLKNFTSCNDVHYVINELFQPELERTVLAAEDYHVLWIHDYRGMNSDGKPDAMGFGQTVNAYMRALTMRVRDYDRTRKIPVFMIILDAHYYHINQGDFYLKCLEDPLHCRIDFPADCGDMIKRFDTAQKALREAVEHSEALQADARRYGKEWLANRVKVHVNITNPSDFSFRSGTLHKDLAMLVPDNVMRDHRKIAFYDVSEFDPAKGEAIMTGMGVGEHYVGPDWDDRSILARGPVILGLKNETRHLLLSQGFQEADIPECLQPFPVPDNYKALCDALRTGGWNAVAMQVHNDAGFGRKQADVVKALLYTLMPPGSHLYIPDSLWNSPFWGCMLAGAALRGCNVLVIAPSIHHSPSAGSMQMSRANQLFKRFVMIRNEMKDEILSAGGLFMPGIYSTDLDVGDVAGKVRLIQEGIAKQELFRQLMPFDSSVVTALDELVRELDSPEYAPSYLVDHGPVRKPKLHCKIQFFASGQTIDSVIPRPEWESIVRKYIIIRAKQAAHDTDQSDVKALRATLEQDAALLMRSWGQNLLPEQRDLALTYLTVGSQNEDYRGMIMDGETLFLTGHSWAMIAYLDFVSLIGQTTWVDDVESLEALLPSHTHFWQRLGWYFKMAL
ncbi:hypothetical protein JW948_08220 [bacterium]|nr:hypothetical protein [bacterium]